MLAEQTRLAAKKRWSSARAARLAIVATASALASSPASASMLSRAPLEASAAQNSRLGIFSNFTPLSVGESAPNSAERIGENGDPRTIFASESREWLSPDPLLGKYMRGEVNRGVFAPRNLGLYSYTWNNPIILRDPNGLAPTPAQIEAFQKGTLDIGREMAAGRMTVADAGELAHAGGVQGVGGAGDM